MQKNHDQSHSHCLNTDHPRSVSQPGLLENDTEKSSDSNSHFDKLITKTSELNELTVQGVHVQSEHTVAWIVLMLAISLILLYVVNYLDN